MHRHLAHCIVAANQPDSHGTPPRGEPPAHKGTKGTNGMAVNAPQPHKAPPTGMQACTCSSVASAALAPQPGSKAKPEAYDVNKIQNEGAYSKA